MTNRLRALSTGWLVATVAGCATYPLTPPDAGVTPPADWNQPVNADQAAWPAPAWWRQFGSSELDRLIEQARSGNHDLAAAVARVYQAEAQARIAGAPLLPAVSLGADAGRDGTLGGAGASSYGLALGASYEVDFWGGNRAALASARAALAASEFDRATVALTVTSGVATAYLQILSLRERLEIARLNLTIAERVLAVVEARARFGAASALELAQQRAAVAGQRAAIPALEQQEREARAALATLLGRVPQGFDVQATGLADFTVPAIAAGVPSGLLERRPDIRRAERQLAAAQADVAAARAALFPSLELSASVGVRAATVSALFDDNPLYSLAAALTAPIFQGGRLRAGEELAAARREELLESYRAAIIAAFADAETALDALGSLDEQAKWQAETVKQATTALGLAETRYRAGAEDLLTVLDAQRTLYQARDQEAQVRLLRLQGAVSLFRALGGGWSATEVAGATTAVR
jgi:NodT family efflux transporter outer membrane factor (OMF) lipoprotein